MLAVMAASTAAILATYTDRLRSRPLLRDEEPWQPTNGVCGNHEWRAMMQHDAQALLALTISALLCLGAWIWARRRLARLSSEPYHHLAFAGQTHSGSESANSERFSGQSVYNRRREGVTTYIKGRKISIEQAHRSPRVENLHLIRKLRWIGMEEEAEQLQMEVQGGARTGSVITISPETD
jgi:hypothetical protein